MSTLTIRQLDRQIGSLFYERTLLSKDKAAMLRKGAKPQPGDALSVDEALRDPLVLEFLNLRDEYSETDLEDALVRHLETFLLELGGDFTFVGRQRRLRVGGAWYRVDLIFFHSRLRCLVVIDLKLGTLDHADAGQMRLYLSYAREHWTHEGENPPVGIILCSSAKNASVIRAFFLRRNCGNKRQRRLIRRTHLCFCNSPLQTSGPFGRRKHSIWRRATTTRRCRRTVSRPACPD